MKTLLFCTLLAVVASSCAKKKELITPSVLVKETCCSPIYYAEILHKELYSVGDTIRIIYNQMPRHEYAYPNSFRYKYVTVVIVKI
jgi:hypothetical protein